MENAWVKIVRETYFGENSTELMRLESDHDRAFYMHNLLVARATGSAVSSSDDDDYKLLRKYFLEEQSIRNYLPKWILTYRDLTQFWSFIKPKFSKYAERTEFLREEFSPLLDFLEQGDKNPAKESIDATLIKFDADNVHRCWQKAIVILPWFSGHHHATNLY